MKPGKYDRVVGQVFNLRIAFTRLTGGLKAAKAGDKIACPTSCALFFLLCAAALAATPEPDLVPVISRQVSRVTELPGEFQPFLIVSLHAKVPGYVDRILVDRGSVVKEGQLLVELSAPEMAARIAEAEARLEAAESERLQAEAQLAAIESTYMRLWARPGRG
jgi:membrane fusion protein, multidrug efflux system